MAGVDGKWECVVDSPMGPQQFVLTVHSSGERFTGDASGAVGGREIEDGLVEGDTLRWTMKVSKPIPITLSCRATVSGDRLEGAVKAGFMGSFPISGTRA
jgi:hypothetical protein